MKQNAPTPAGDDVDDCVAMPAAPAAPAPKQAPPILVRLGDLAAPAERSPAPVAAADAPRQEVPPAAETTHAAEPSADTNADTNTAGKSAATPSSSHPDPVATQSPTTQSATTQSAAQQPAAQPQRRTDAAAAEPNHRRQHRRPADDASDPFYDKQRRPQPWSPEKLWGANGRTKALTAALAVAAVAVLYYALTGSGGGQLAPLDDDDPWAPAPLVQQAPPATELSPVAPMRATTDNLAAQRPIEPSPTLSNSRPSAEHGAQPEVAAQTRPPAEVDAPRDDRHFLPWRHEQTASHEQPADPRAGAMNRAAPGIAPLAQPQYSYPVTDPATYLYPEGVLSDSAQGGAAETAQRPDPFYVPQ